MAITVTAVTPQGVTTKAWSIVATLDGDTASGNIPHGFGAAPFVVFVSPRLAAGVLAGWFVSTIDATNIVVTKGTTVGSGNAGVQAVLYALAPHTLIG
jgi:hypothetical protein